MTLPDALHLAVLAIIAAELAIIVAIMWEMRR